MVSPSGQSIRVNAPPTSSAAAIPEMTVRTSKARNWAFWSVKLTPVATPRVLYDELELVELVAERHRQQEQPAEDGEVDADRRREDEPAARGADEVARQRQQQGGDDERR